MVDWLMVNMMVAIMVDNILHRFTVAAEAQMREGPVQWSSVGDATSGIGDHHRHYHHHHHYRFHYRRRHRHPRHHYEQQKQICNNVKISQSCHPHHYRHHLNHDISSFASLTAMFRITISSLGPS